MTCLLAHDRQVMINAVIVENKPNALQLLQQYMHQYCPEVHIAGTATDANTAYKLILKHKPRGLARKSAYFLSYSTFSFYQHCFYLEICFYGWGLFVGGR